MLGANDDPPGLDRADWWSPGDEYGSGELKIVPPERFPEITEALLARGYSETDTAKILGGNFMRVAGETWSAIP
jgi:membrane dipeptidase